jgi:hypothetical protein
VRLCREHARRLADVRARGSDPPARKRAFHRDGACDGARKPSPRVAASAWPGSTPESVLGWNASASSLAHSRAGQGQPAAAAARRAPDMTYTSRLDRAPGGGPLSSGRFPSRGRGSTLHAVPQPGPTSVDVRRESREGPSMGRPHPRGYTAPRASPQGRLAFI